VPGLVQHGAWHRQLRTGGHPRARLSAAPRCAPVRHHAPAGEGQATADYRREAVARPRPAASTRGAAVPRGLGATMANSETPPEEPKATPSLPSEGGATAPPSGEPARAAPPPEGEASAPAAPRPAAAAGEGAQAAQPPAETTGAAERPARPARPAPAAGEGAAAEGTAAGPPAAPTERP